MSAPYFCPKLRFSFLIFKLTPLDLNSAASEAVTIPLPNDETTPPVTKINFTSEELQEFFQIDFRQFQFH